MTALDGRELVGQREEDGDTRIVSQSSQV